MQTKYPFRAIILKCLVILVLIFAIPLQAIATEGFVNEYGNCVAYFWKRGKAVGLTSGRHINFRTLDGAWLPTYPKYPYESSNGMSYAAYVWGGTSWNRFHYFSNYYFHSDKMPKMISFFTEKKIPEGIDPRGYWSDGPPANCGIDPFKNVPLDTNQGPPECTEPTNCCNQ